MKSTKVYKVLSRLSSKHLNRFLKFVNSPYFNNNEKLSAFAALLIEAIKKKSTKEELPGKKEFFEELSKAEYDDQKFRTHSSQLLQLFESFLIYEEFERKDLKKFNYLLEGIRKHQIDELLKKAVENGTKFYDRQIQRSSQYMLESFELEGSKFNLLPDFERRNSVKIKSYTLEDVRQMTRPLDKFYFIEKLKHEAQIINFARKNKLEYSSEGILLLLEQINNLQDEYLGAEDYLSLMVKILLDNEDVDSYQELKDNYESWNEILEEQEVKDVFNNMFTFSIIRANRGDRSFYNEVFELYKLGIETKAILIDNTLSVTSFRNAVLAALKTDNSEFAEQFINEYSDLLPPNEKENAVSFSLARIAMHQKNWKKAIEYISRVDFEDEAYNLNSRLMMLNSYYELQEYDALDSLIDSYSVYLRRKDNIQDSVKFSFLNHVRYLRKITKANKGDDDKLDIIQKELNSNEFVINKAWLLEKIEELR